MDIFTLDVMTEMLESPLYFLSYVDKRTGYADKIIASHELVLISQHLKRNLWFEDKYDTILLEDDILADLDVAMSVRRDNVWKANSRGHSDSDCQDLGGENLEGNRNTSRPADSRPRIHASDTRRKRPS